MAVVRAWISEEFREFIREVMLASFPALLLCLLLDFFAGAFLGKFFDKIMNEYPIILVILPGLMGLRETSTARLPPASLQCSILVK